MRLRIAFVGYNEEQTRSHFREMAALNRKQINMHNLEYGRIVLRDGTEIIRVSPAVRYINVPFDQVIIADDHRKRCEIENRALFARLAMNMSGSQVPPEFRWQYYDLDAEVE